MTYTYDYLESRLGRLTIVAKDDTIAGVHFEQYRHAIAIADDWRRDEGRAMIRRCADELRAYFAGELTCFTVALAPEGTAFQRAIWEAIAAVPYGKTTTYGRLAECVGRPGHARAAGAATGSNPIGIIIPCHRVVGASGALTGYGGGLDRKRALLALESGARLLLA